MTPRLLARRLGGSVDHATRGLASLAALGLVGREDGAFAYRPTDLDATVDRLADLWVSRKVEIVSQLHWPVRESSRAVRR